MFLPWAVPFTVEQDLWDWYLYDRARHARPVGRHRTGLGACLDLGCGTGIAIPGLLERGWRVVRVDLSGDQLRVARQRAGPTGAVLVTADATALPFPDDSFDAVVSVLTHTTSMIPRSPSPTPPGCCDAADA